MNIFEKILLFLQGTMETPKTFGWFHLMCIFFTIISIILLYNKKHKYSEKKLKIVLFTFGSIALLFEILKQLIWSFNYDPVTNIITWDYQWDSFPFQLCTTPIYVSLICAFMKENKIRKSLLSYLAFITILGSVATIIIPDSCFVEDILVNIHTMWLHCGGLVISVYLLMSNEIKPNINNIKNATCTFLIFVGIALLLNIVAYNTGIIGNETFNMFYISPYFETILPVFNIIYQNVPYLIFLIIYIWAIIIGSLTIFGITKMIKKLTKKSI